MESVNAFLRRYPRVSTIQENLIEGSNADTVEEDDMALDVEDDAEVGSHQSLDDAARSDAGQLEEADIEGQPIVASAVPSVQAKVLKRHATKLVDFVESDEENDKPVYDRITLAILAHFCDILSLDRSQIDRSGLKTDKRRLFNFLLEEVRRLSNYMTANNLVLLTAEFRP